MCRPPAAEPFPQSPDAGEAMMPFIDLLRHGEPVGGRRYRGQLDDPLSEQGWSEMWAAVADEPGYQVIVSSPLQRCHAFAAAYAEAHGLPLAVNAAWREIGMGSWEGLTRREARDQDPDLFDRFYRDPVHNRPPGAESLDAFRRRIGAAWRSLLAEHPSGGVLMIVHAGTIRGVVGEVLGLPSAHFYGCQVEYAARVRILLRDNGLQQILFPGPIDSA